MKFNQYKLPDRKYLIEFLERRQYTKEDILRLII